MTITKKTMLLEREPLAVSTDGTLKIMTAKADGNDWEFTGSGFQVWTPGQRGIPLVIYNFGGERLRLTDSEMVASADGTTLRPNDDMIETFRQILGTTACEGTAEITYTSRPDYPYDELIVPIRYNPV